MGTLLAAHYNALVAAMRVLYDGWPLLYAPESAEALHLRTLLALAQEDLELLLALPVGVEIETNSKKIRNVLAETHDQGAWQQRVLPRLAEEQQADWVHTTQLAATLFGKAPTLVSPASSDLSDSGSHSLRGRIAAAQGRGGLARATILWPEDLPDPNLPGTLRKLPPVAHPDFQPGKAMPPVGLELPEEYLLYHGAGDQGALLRLLESWTWAAASIGELYPLVMLGLDEEAKRFLEKRLPEFHVQDSVHLLPQVDAQHLPAIYQNCIAVVHPGPPAPWGGTLRHGLACGKAIVAHQEALTEAMVGPAAYLISSDDLRAFGAAIITVAVDEKAREKLEAAANQRSASWKAIAFQIELKHVMEKARKV